MGHALVEESITVDNRTEVSFALHGALNGVDTANFAFPLATKDGRRIAVLLNATTRRDAAGEVSGAVGVGLVMSKCVGCLTIRSGSSGRPTPPSSASTPRGT